MLNIPKVSILLPTYMPSYEFLKDQLISIENQTYNNTELILCDDSENEEVFNKIEILLNKTMKKVPFKILKNDKNIGSNKTFEKLTLIADGEFISYCDQDDFWEMDKTEKLVEGLRNNNYSLVYSDLAVMDEDNLIKESSFKKLNFRLKHIEGKDCFFRLLRRNSVTGCTMMIRSEVAKKACPFPSMDIYPHDHWLAIYGSVNGGIKYNKETLTNYRIHSNNQIGNKRFIGIENVGDYTHDRIGSQLKRYDFVEKHIKLNTKRLKEITLEREMINTRREFHINQSIYTLYRLLKFLKYDPILILFEVILFSVPQRIASKIINALK